MSARINQPLTQAQAWKQFREVALLSENDPSLVDCPDWRESYKLAHAVWARIYTDCIA